MDANETNDIVVKPTTREKSNNEKNIYEREWVRKIDMAKSGKVSRIRIFRRFEKWSDAITVDIENEVEFKMEMWPWEK